MNTLNTVEQVAIHKSFKSAVLKELESGEYSGSVTVKIDYCIRKGKDYTQACTASISPLDALVIAFSHVNENTKKAILKDFARSFIDGVEIVSESDREKVSEYIASVCKAVEKSFSGKTTAKIQVQKV